MRKIEVEGEVVAKSYPHAKRMVRQSLKRLYKNYKVLFVSVEQRDGLRLHSSPVCCYTYFALLKPQERGREVT